MIPLLITLMLHGLNILESNSRTFLIFLKVTDAAILFNPQLPHKLLFSHIPSSLLVAYHSASLFLQVLGL